MKQTAAHTVVIDHRTRAHQDEDTRFSPLQKLRVNHGGIHFIFSDPGTRRPDHRINDFTGNPSRFFEHADLLRTLYPTKILDPRTCIRKCCLWQGCYKSHIVIVGQVVSGNYVAVRDYSE